MSLLLCTHRHTNTGSVVAPSSPPSSRWEGSCQTSTPVASFLFLPQFNTADAVTALTSLPPRDGPDTGPGHSSGHAHVYDAHTQIRIIHTPYQTHSFTFGGVPQEPDPQPRCSSRGAGPVLTFPSQSSQPSWVYRIELPQDMYTGRRSCLSRQRLTSLSFLSPLAWALSPFLSQNSEVLTLLRSDFI